MQTKSSTPDVQDRAGIQEQRGNGQGPPAVAGAIRSSFTGIDSLARSAATMAGENLEQVRARFASGLIAARASVSTAVERTRQSAAATDAYVHRKPWQAIGAGALIGLVLGVLLARRGSSASP
jgi:ElaB/YqjD/DUF883 family membrane-anchored ribosome-binding protein